MSVADVEYFLTSLRIISTLCVTKGREYEVLTEIINCSLSPYAVSLSRSLAQEVPAYGQLVGIDLPHHHMGAVCEVPAGGP